MNERELFLAALDLDDVDERVRFLAEQCGADRDRLERLQHLLLAKSAAGSFLEAPAMVAAGNAATVTSAGTGEAVTADHSSNNEQAGAVIAGKYRLSERIGAGGMGSVWVAHQSEPVRRKVAVKLIKAGMDSAQVVARFEAERQALAVMDHPNIAKVLDGGLHQGRPFFVMELVKGVPITAYCDARKLTPRERLGLFVPVCQAIQHAHTKGIIHRDIKPSNVLVALYDDKPVPKVIDFGIAKATGGALTEQTIETAFGGVVGTPQYMSPEQASLNNLDIDTRSDVYSLGVLLYELLTGSPPFARKELQKAGLLELLRVVREEEPPRPSHKLSTADALPSLSASRGTEPKKLTGLLRNELDWIVMKALEKDRARRYETANGFAADVNRYLSGDAVQAHPPSTTYRVKKFVRRHRAQVTAGSLVLVALLVGFAGTLFGLMRAEERRREAEQAREREKDRADGERQAKQRALAEKARAEKAEVETLASYRASTDDAIEQLIGSKPQLGPSERRYLENAANRWQAFANRKGDDERARAARGEGHMHVGLLWAKLGRRDEALREFEQAVAIGEKLTGDYPAVPIYRLVLAMSRNNLGILLRGLGKRPEAEEQYRRALAICHDLAAEFPAEPKYRRTLSNIHHSLGTLLGNSRTWPEAGVHYRQAIALLEKLVGEFPRVPAYRQELARTHNNLGNQFEKLGKLPEAEEQHRRALAICHDLAAEFPAEPAYRQGLASAHHSLANLLFFDLGKRPEAEEQHRQALAIREKLAAEFPATPAHQLDLGGSYCNFGTLVSKSGRPDEGLVWYEKAFRIVTPVYEQDQRSAQARQLLQSIYFNRAFAHNDLQKYADALKDWDRAVELSTEEEQPFARAGRAVSRMHAGQVAEAVADVAELTKPRVVDATGSPKWTVAEWYNFACVYAVASAKITDEKQNYADRSMELLQKAVQAGYKDAAHMKKDTDLEPLREREDFKKLLAALDAKTEKK